MGVQPLPPGNNAAEMIRRLRAIDAEIFGTLYAQAGIIGGDVVIEGTATIDDILSTGWVGGGGADPVNLATYDTGATAGYAWDASVGSAQLMGNLFIGGNINFIDAGGILNWYDGADVLQAYIRVDGTSGLMRITGTGGATLEMSSIIEMNDVEVTDFLKLSAGTGNLIMEAATEASNTSDAQIRQGYSGGTGNWTEWVSHVSTSMAGMSMGMYSDVFQMTDSASGVTAGNLMLEISRAGSLSLYGSGNQLAIYSRDNDDQVAILYNPTGNELHSYISGATRFRVHASGAEVTGTLTASVIDLSNEIQFPLGGSSSDPSAAWGDGDTGIFESTDGKLQFTAEGTDRFMVDGRAGANAVNVVNAGFGVGFQNTLLTSNYIYNTPPTSGSAANALWILAAGSIYYLVRSTSSRRYKRKIKDWGETTWISRLRPVSYKGSAAEPLHDGEGEPLRDRKGEPKYKRTWNKYRSFGLIAEEVYDEFPAAAVLDEDGKPDGIDWNVITAALVSEVQELQARVRELENA